MNFYFCNVIVIDRKLHVTYTHNSKYFDMHNIQKKEQYRSSVYLTYILMPLIFYKLQLV